MNRFTGIRLGAFSIQGCHRVLAWLLLTHCVWYPLPGCLLSAGLPLTHCVRCDLLLQAYKRHLSSVIAFFPQCVCMCTLLQDYKKHLLEVIPVENLPEMFGGLSRTESFKVRGGMGGCL